MIATLLLSLLEGAETGGYALTDEACAALFTRSVEIGFDWLDVLHLGKPIDVRSDLAGLEEFESLAIKLRTVEETLPSDRTNLKAVSELIAARERSIAEARRSIESLGQSRGV